MRRGSIDFDLPEPLLEFDEFGEMTGVTRAPRNIAHRLIEEFMLAANEAVASHLEAAGSSLDLPHSRAARPQARAGIRGDRRRISAIRSAPGAAPVKRFRGTLRHGLGQTLRSARWPGQSQSDFAQLPEAGAENRRQTGGADSELPDAALAQTGPLQRTRTWATSRWPRPATRISPRPFAAIPI